jgi:outer membrane protein assembly factor BamB
MICTRAQASDWPMYRADAARSAYTAEELPGKLALAWTHRIAAAPMPAWPSESRMTFDRAYQPVIAGPMLYFGSSADGKIHALDAATGAIRWTFPTGGPVRFAPTVWQQRVFAAGDDGWLVCLDAADGRLQWRHRLAPKPDLLLGNDRMISRWPARGGPVVADEVLYVAAGIWPSEGIFLYAFEPSSGKVLWCNDSSGGIEMAQPHPGARARSGVSAQGYLVAHGSELLVPTGRAVPAVFDRASGAMKSFPLAANIHHGGADVTAFDGQWFNQGRLFSPEKGVAPQVIGAQMALHPRWVLACRRDRLAAYDRKQLWVATTSTDRAGKKVSTKALSAPAWTSTLPGTDIAAMIVAGQRAAVGGTDSVWLVDLASRQTVWTGQVEGSACGLAASGGRLYVSTDKGRLYCFQDAQHSGPAVEQGPALNAPADQRDEFAAAAAEVLKAGGVREGYCLDLGCGEGRLTLELAKRSKLQIVAVDRDAESLERLRRTLDAAGWLNTRVTVLQAEPDRIPCARWFADLVVSGRSVVEGAACVPQAAIERFQRPWGGMACVGKPGAMTVSTRAALEGAGQWTHQYADPANTLCSSDTRLKGPLAMLWFRDTDVAMPNRHGRSPAPLVAQGRMIVEGLKSLRAVSVYNGRTLWEAPLPGLLKPYDQDHLVGTAATGSNLCAGADRVFLAQGDRCTAYRLSDGSKLCDLAAPVPADIKKSRWGFLAVEGGTVFGSLVNDGHVVQYRFQKSDMSDLWTESRVLFAVDCETGKVKWTYTARDSVRHNAIAIGRGRVYLIDRPLALKDGIRFIVPRATSGPSSKPPAGGDVPPPPKHAPGRLIALDAETGRVAWETSEDVFGTLLALSARHGVLLMAYQPGAFQLPSEEGGRMAGFQADDGKRLWDIKAKYTTRPILNDRSVYAQPGAWDLLTGRALAVQFKRSYGCGIPAASQGMLVFRSATIGYLDLASPERTENYGGIRPGCWVNMVPAGGVVLLADAATGCECSYLNKATLALQPPEP